MNAHGTKNKKPLPKKLPEKTNVVFYKQLILVAVENVALVVVAEIAARYDVINLVLAGWVVAVHFQPHAPAGTPPMFTVIGEPLGFQHSPSHDLLRF